MKGSLERLALAGMTLVFCRPAPAGSDAGPAETIATKGPPAPPPTGRGPFGTWDVEQVAVDGQDRAHWSFRPNDPQLMWRELVIDSTSVRFNGSNLSCKQSRWAARSSTWGSLIGKAFPRPTDGGRRATPTPSDFDLNVPRAAAVTVYSICPDANGNAGTVFPDGQWVAVKGPDTLALRLDGSALLILTRRSPGAKPRASFSCAKATTPTEKAICADFALAAWDRSVATAWREAIENPAKNQEELYAAQKEWLRKRDACGGDASCLAAEMFQRVNALARRY